MIALDSSSIQVVEWLEEKSFLCSLSSSSSSTNITLSYTRKPSIIQLQKTKLRQYSGRVTHTKERNPIESFAFVSSLSSRVLTPQRELRSYLSVLNEYYVCVFAFDIRFGLVQLRCHDCCCCCYFYGVVAHVEEELLLDETAMNSLVEKSRSSTPFHSIS